MSISYTGCENLVNFQIVYIEVLSVKLKKGSTSVSFHLNFVNVRNNAGKEGSIKTF